jgi:rsbT co-antagonist protein RsbR
MSEQRDEIISTSDDQAVVRKDAERLFARMLSSAPLILWAMDTAGNVTHAEGKGMELAAVQGGPTQTNVFEMFKDNAEITEGLLRALAGEEARFVSQLGPEQFFDNWFMPVRAEDGNVSGLIGLAMDASARIKSEREIREKLELIERQSATIRALATPIIKIWDEVLCLPVIGTVDSARTAEMMQSLLEAIVREQARFAIVDLTGVEVVDTSTADHLIQLFRAAKVVGVEGILCGIRPAVAQTVVALGLELGTVRTMRSLRDALKWCIRARGTAQAPSAEAR